MFSLVCAIVRLNDKLKHSDSIATFMPSVSPENCIKLQTGYSFQRIFVCMKKHISLSHIKLHFDGSKMVEYWQVHTVQTNTYI